MSFTSALPLTDGDHTLVELARATIDSPDGLVGVLACELLPSGYDYLAEQH
ncbi:MAG: hypothetical protein ACOH2Q_19820 [Rhodococcus sp. (in: high G+C Gram-positive bacteria)]